ncbi:MAG: HAMP domain-containing sensor histidine kinase, partial [Cytophagales bacterium]|nr:HAMP domain-containing histidine kinase [Bernardetiaceae bacterium]MDW8205982.1 HAMP domain-containing sensor histidine kinase [Cytophagales bacterium]
KLAELNDFKNRLFLMIAHDLRSPMAALKTTIDVLNPDILKGEELERIRQELQRQFNATDETLQELLAWTRSQMEGEVLRPVGINLQDAVRQITEFLGNVAQAKNISVRNEVPPDIKVRADANHLSAIMRNLIANAIKFTLPNGAVTVKAAVANQMVEIAVEDTGIGMSQERLQRLFNGERFFSHGTAGEKGTGLGLIMVQNMVAKNGGSIRAESQEGKGSIFYFTLPLAN